MRIAWMLGWAVPETWFSPFARATFPQAEHGFFEPSPMWLNEIKSAGPWDAIAGYSLGTLLMLEQATEVAGLAPRVVLLSPVFAFPKEEGLGGKMACAQVRYLSRWLKTDRAAALTDFYARAGLEGCVAEETSAPVETLRWGLDKLAHGRVDPPLPHGWQAYGGEGDALLDISELKRGDRSIKCVEGATHHPEALIRAMEADFS